MINRHHDNGSLMWALIPRLVFGWCLLTYSRSCYLGLEARPVDCWFWVVRTWTKGARIPLSVIR
jgi:hypothetical protein